ncbi:MAG: Spy/CpxP family protein refolding chaperone [Variibacter sp.]|nr:Spy/CpxP family protein refolding chaperone [Variibacter sp.]
MSDQSSTQGPPPATANPPAGRSCRRRGPRVLILLLLLLAAGFTGAFVTKAMSSDYGFGPRHWRGGFMDGPFDPGRAEDRADRMVRHLAVEVDASAEQQAKLRAIVAAAVKDILPMREQAQNARRQVRTLLTQPTIDRAAIEKFRTDQLALADAFSKRVSQAIADAAEVLNAEQRRKLEDRLDRFRGHRRWNRG